MKHFKIAVLIAICILLISSSKNLFAQKSNILEIRGHTYIGEEKVDKAFVKLYQNNKVVQIIYTKKNGKFDFVLFSGTQYIVEVNKPGYISERIQISTKEQTKSNNKYFYEFKVDLMDAKKFKDVDISTLDFPTAIIKYDKENDTYLHDRAYSKSVKTELKELKSKARNN